MAGQQPPTRGALRVVRGGVLALTSAALAVAAHAVGGGMLPDTGLTVLLTLGVAGCGIAFADRRHGPLAMLAVLGPTQLGMHLILGLSAHPGGMAPDLIDGRLMTAGHSLAVLISALLLAHAESAVFALAAACALVLPPRTLALPAPPEPTPSAPCPVPVADRYRAVLLRRACARRGPPVAG